MTQHLVVAVKNLSWTCFFSSFLTSGHRGSGYHEKWKRCLDRAALFGLQGRTWKSLHFSLERNQAKGSSRKVQADWDRLRERLTGFTDGFVVRKAFGAYGSLSWNGKLAGASVSGQPAICGACAQCCSGYSYVLENLQNPMLAFKCQVSDTGHDL